MSYDPILKKIKEFSDSKEPEALLVCDFILDHLLYDCDRMSDEEIKESVLKIAEKIRDHANDVIKDLGKNDYISLTWTVEDIISTSENIFDKPLTEEESLDFISKYTDKIIDKQIEQGWQVIDMYLQEYKDIRNGKSTT